MKTNNLQKPEILAPAGSLEILFSAIAAGADAVYCSGKRFGARQFAPNFTNEEIIIASKYVHLRKKKIYITVNTLVFENELAELKEYLAFLYQYVDGVIVQDLGVIHYIRKTYPDFPVHLSTQCNVHNVATSSFFQKLGLSRIVLARETPLEVIKQIVDLGIEVEVFIHGALCFSYSGNCYFSYSIGGRSGNRGSCAQPCRKQYSLYEDDKCLIENSSLLSMKDLMTLPNIEKLCDLGLRSFKIEGRMKQKEYVVSVIKAYRKAIDAWYEKQTYQIEEETIDNLKVTFNRSFTDGYIFNADNIDLTNQKSVNHQGLLIGEVISSSKKQATVKLLKPLIMHDAIRFVSSNTEECGFIVTRIIKENQLVKEAKEADIIILDVPNFLERGTKVFKTQDAKIAKDAQNLINNEQIFNPIKGILEVTFKTISFQITDDENSVSTTHNVFLEPANKEIDYERIKSQTSKLAKLPFVFTDLKINFKDKAFLPLPLLNQLRSETLQKWQELLENKKRRINIPYAYQNKHQESIPQIKQNIKILDHQLSETSPRINFYESHSKYQVIEQLGHIHSTADISPYLNVSNHFAIDLVRNFTNGIIYLSLETPQDTFYDLSKYDNNLGILIYSMFPVMISRHCVVPTAYKVRCKECNLCQKHQYYLMDSYQNKFPLYFENCNMIILNSTPLNKLAEDLDQYFVNNFLIEFYQESELEKNIILNKSKSRFQI